MRKFGFGLADGGEDEGRSGSAGEPEERVGFGEEKRVRMEN